MSYMVLGYGSYDAPETEIDIDRRTRFVYAC